MSRREPPMGSHIIASAFTKSRRKPSARIHAMIGKRIADVFGRMVCVDGEDCLDVTMIRFTDGSSLALAPVASQPADEAYVVGELLRGSS